MSLEADGMIMIYDIETGVVVAQYEGLEVHEAMLAMKAAQHGVEPTELPRAYLAIELTNEQLKYLLTFGGSR